MGHPVAVACVVRNHLLKWLVIKLRN